MRIQVKSIDSNQSLNIMNTLGFHIYTIFERTRVQGYKQKCNKSASITPTLQMILMKGNAK
jgi:hypothetical protein